MKTDSGPSKPPGAGGLDGFEQLLRKLGAVPEAELDAEIRKYERRKKRRNARIE